MVRLMPSQELIRFLTHIINLSMKQLKILKRIIKRSLIKTLNYKNNCMKKDKKFSLRRITCRNSKRRTKTLKHSFKLRWLIIPSWILNSRVYQINLQNWRSRMTNKLNLSILLILNLLESTNILELKLIPWNLLIVKAEVHLLIRTHFTMHKKLMKISILHFRLCYITQYVHKIMKMSNKAILKRVIICLEHM